MFPPRRGAGACTPRLTAISPPTERAEAIRQAISSKQIHVIASEDLGGPQPRLLSTARAPYECTHCCAPTSCCAHQARRRGWDGFGYPTLPPVRLQTLRRNPTVIKEQKPSGASKS